MLALDIDTRNVEPTWIENQEEGIAPLKIENTHDALAETSPHPETEANPPPGIIENTHHQITEDPERPSTLVMNEDDQDRLILTRRPSETLRGCWLEDMTAISWI